ncbi:MAG: hypothetical protein ABW252_24670 [Polyangiales bacterium]
MQCSRWVSLALLSSVLSACGGGDAAPRDDDDAGVARPDGGGGDAAVDDDCVPYVAPSAEACRPPSDGPLPADLRCTGLYGDFDARALACGVLAYKPAFELWSDGAEKHRYAWFPPGSKIDVRNADEFSYPEGTKFWKEFRVAGVGGAMRLAETRLLEKSADGWLYTSYVWSADEKEARQMVNATGVADLLGTGHIVPTREQCGECHKGRRDFVLGWDALMLGPGAEGVTREDLQKRGLVDDASTLALSIPGSAVERAALGTMHVNCGISCHNENVEAAGRDSGLHLRLERAELASVRATDAFKAINKRPNVNAKYDGLANRDPNNWYGIRPGDPARSLMIARQTLRGFEGQMPRIATKKVDEAGVEAVTAWIESMTGDAAYPAPAP